MRVQFVNREDGPERLVCEAEILFDAEDGPLAGMKLVGFCVWQGADGENYVTFPSRAFGAGSERRLWGGRCNAEVRYGARVARA